MARGPFTAIYPGGLHTASVYYDAASNVYYPFSIETAKEHLAKAGLVDTDGNGWVNYPAETLGGADVEITLLANTDIVTDKNIGEGVQAMLEPLGLRVISNMMSDTQTSANTQSGKFDWLVYRNSSELVTVVQNTSALAPLGPQTNTFHRAGSDGTVDLLPFEEELVDAVQAFVASRDPDRRIDLMKNYQRIYTENVYSAGLTHYAAALVINNRFANVPAGAPNFMYNWGEDSIMRERIFVPTDKQQDFELFPETLPGAPGAPSPAS